MVHRTRAALARYQLPQLVVQERLLLGFQLIHPILQLERVDPQIVEGDQARGELAVEEVVRGVDGAHAGVGVVVGVHAEAEGSGGPHGGRLPVLLVVVEAVHAFGSALLYELVLLALFAQLAAQLLLLEAALSFFDAVALGRPGRGGRLAVTVVAVVARVVVGKGGVGRRGLQRKNCTLILASRLNLLSWLWWLRLSSTP
mgnify:FL=1